MIDRPDTGLKAGYIMRMHGEGCIMFIQRFRLDLTDFAPPAICMDTDPFNQVPTSAGGNSRLM